MYVSEACQSLHLGGLVASGAGGGQRLVVEDAGFVVVAVSAEVAVQDARQVPQVHRPVVFGGVSRGGQQVGQLAVQPVQRRGVGQGRDRGAGGRDLRTVRALIRVGGVHRDRGGVPVVVQQPVQRHVPGGLGLVAGGGVGGVRADQVVEPVPIRGGFLQEVCFQ